MHLLMKVGFLLFFATPFNANAFGAIDGRGGTAKSCFKRLVIVIILTIRAKEENGYNFVAIEKCQNKCGIVKPFQKKVKIRPSSTSACTCAVITTLR